MEIAKKESKDLIMTFIDIEKAFDSVSHSDVFELLLS